MNGEEGRVAVTSITLLTTPEMARQYVETIEKTSALFAAYKARNETARVDSERAVNSRDCREAFVASYAKRFPLRCVQHQGGVFYGETQEHYETWLEAKLYNKDGETLQCEAP